MTRVSSSVVVPGRIADAEELWYDLSRWPAFVDGFAHVVKVDGDWPREGRLVWRSNPHGRGGVAEEVRRFEARLGQTADVEDERLRGTQQIAFQAEGDAVRVTLSLDYELKQRTALTPVVDVLFVRRAVREALRRTLDRFARERRGDAEMGL